MRYRAGDGRVFPNVQQGRQYDYYLQSLPGRGREMTNQAPGGPAHEMAVRNHGTAKELHIVYQGPSRWRATSVHADGHRHTEVRPEAYLAHQIGGTLLGSDNPPLGIATHRNSRNQPIGPKENDEIRKADRRERDDAIEFDDYERD